MSSGRLSFPLLLIPADSLPLLIRERSSAGRAGRKALVVAGSSPAVPRPKVTKEHRWCATALILKSLVGDHNWGMRSVRRVSEGAGEIRLPFFMQSYSSQV